MSGVPNFPRPSTRSSAPDHLEIEEFADSDVLEALSRHRCVACGECCRWHGYVFLYSHDIKNLAQRLGVSEDEFLRGRCIVLRWSWADSLQFRIALARKPASNECTFLSGSKCGIHAFKPLLCKAGPAAWPWIRDPQAFWFFERTSPSFRNPAGVLPRSDANSWFVRTREAEEVASGATSLAALARVCEVSEAVLGGLAVVEFKSKEEVDHVWNT